MSDHFAKNLKKHSTRAKEKLMVSLGKADQTVDEDFDDHSANFNRQQKANERLHKELKNYVTCLKAVAAASKGFQEAVRETYEPEWPGGEHVRAMSQSLDLVWEDFHDKMVAQVLNPVGAHANQFMDMRAKIAKRGRKLVDYDSARHTADAAKNQSEVKQQKAQESMLLAKKMYEDLNQELRDELPALYDSRITFYVSTMQSVFNLEQTFHSETAKLSRELCVQMDELGHALGRLRVPRSRTDSLPNALPPSTINNNHKPTKPEPETVYPVCSMDELGHALGRLRVPRSRTDSLPNALPPSTINNNHKPTKPEPETVYPVCSMDELGHALGRLRVPRSRTDSLPNALPPSTINNNHKPTKPEPETVYPVCSMDELGHALGRLRVPRSRTDSLPNALPPSTINNNHKPTKPEPETVYPVCSMDELGHALGRLRVPRSRTDSLPNALPPSTINNNHKPTKPEPETVYPVCSMDELGHALGRLRVPRSRTDSLPNALPPSTINNNHKPTKPEPETVYPVCSMDELGHALGRLRVPRSRTDSLPNALPPSTMNNNHKPTKPEPETVYPKLETASLNGSKPASVNGEKEEKKETTNPFGSSDSEPSSRRVSEEPQAIAARMEELDIKTEKAEEEEPKEEQETVEEKTADSPPSGDKANVLYKVRATHRYAAEDSDELNFEAGEVIEVMPFIDPDEQDEGWLYGRKETGGESGVFPANFTKPL